MSNREIDLIDQPTESELMSGVAEHLPRARYHMMIVSSSGSGCQIISDKTKIPEGWTVLNNYEENKPIGSPVGYTYSTREHPAGLMDQIHTHDPDCSYFNGIPVKVQPNRGSVKDSGICH